jgi:hypothetical protein
VIKPKSVAFIVPLQSFRDVGDLRRAKATTHS